VNLNGRSEQTRVHSAHAHFKWLHQTWCARTIKVNLGGNILKTIFGTALVPDVHELHDVLDDVQNRNTGIVHSLANELTYVKKVADTPSHNTDYCESF